MKSEDGRLVMRPSSNDQGSVQQLKRHKQGWRVLDREDVLSALEQILARRT